MDSTSSRTGLARRTLHSFQGYDSKHGDQARATLIADYSYVNKFSYDELVEQSMRKLGHDESVHFFGHDEDHHRVWDYELGDHPCRTVCCIKDHRADILTGRGTRIWGLDSSTDPRDDSYILKDSSIDHNRFPERELLETINQTLKDTGDPRARHFLSVHQGGIVQLSYGRDDAINKGVLGISLLGKARSGSKHSLRAVRDQESCDRNASSMPYKINDLRRKESSGHVSSTLRRHVRMVHKEVCYRMTDLRRMYHIMLALAGVACGMKLIALAESRL